MKKSFKHSREQLKAGSEENNIFGTSYNGANNPYIEIDNIRSPYYGSVANTTPLEYPGLLHDLYYDSFGSDVAGASGLFRFTKAAPGDWAFVGRQLMLAGKYMFADPSLAIKAFTMGIGLGAVALPKTFYYPIRSIYR